MPAVGCFDASAFQRLVEGQFAVDELEHIASHLERCARCTRLVQNLPDDKLIALVGSVKRLPAQSAEASHLQTLIQRMLNVRGNVETLDQLAFASQAAGTAPASAAAAAQPAALQRAAPSQFIGRYRVVRELGRGGMGTVYQAEDMELRRLVALKVPQFSGPPEHQKLMRQRFLREARAAAAVEHQYVCKIHDVGEQDGTPFVVMAFVEGPSLAGRMAKLRRVSDRGAVALILRIAEALLAVHAKGIIHRDLKPANILLPNDATPILTDFGLAHVHSDSVHLTGEGALLGTPAYMAPEQAVAELGPVTMRTDLYSLAVVLFQLLTGRLPVEGDVMQIIAHHVARKPAPPPSHFRPDLDPLLDAIIRKAMALRPEDRQKDVGEFSQALKEWGRGTAAKPGGAAETGPVRQGAAVETMAPLAAVPAPTVAQPGTLPIAGIPTGPQPLAPPAVQPSAVALPHPVPVRSEPRRWAWWQPAAAVLLLAGGITLGIVVARGKKDDPDAGGLVNRDDKKTAAQPAEEKKRDSIDENFSNEKDQAEGLPKGWKGEGFRLAKQGTETWLEMGKTGPESFVTLPSPLALRDKVQISGECFLPYGHSLKIRLKAGKESIPDTVIHYDGSVDILGANHARPVAVQGPKFKFSLTREGNFLIVQLNNKYVGKKELPDLNFDTLSIGMTLGSKLHHLKVGSAAQ